jgi:HTH-type transcriptional regulator / antitoxin HigA
MTTSTLNKIASAKSSYTQLVTSFPPRVIQNTTQLHEAHTVIERLIGLGDDLSDDQSDYLELLSTLVENYESAQILPPTLSTAELLTHLIEAKGVSQANVAEETQIPKSVISEAVNGKRGLSIDNIKTLARFFNVDVSVFVECADA